MKKITRFSARAISLIVILIGLPFYFGYGNPLPFINPDYSLWDNLWLTIFPVMFVGLALSWKYEKIGGFLVVLPLAFGLLFSLVTQGELIFHMLIPLFSGVLFLISAYSKKIQKHPVSKNKK